MSLGIVIKGPEGLVLAADSRVTLEARPPGAEHPLIVNFDNASKLLTFPAPHQSVGAVTFGAAVIGLRTAHSFLPELETRLPSQRVPVLVFAKALSTFYLEQWNSVPNHPPLPMSFIVGGFDEDAAYGSVFAFDIPNNPEPSPRNAGEHDFGMTWGGQVNFVTRLIHGSDPGLPALLAAALGKTPDEVAAAMSAVRPQMEFRVPYQVLPLQDCIDLATFLIRTTATAQGLSIGVRGVGGEIEVAYVRRTTKLTFIQRKTLHGELGSTGAQSEPRGES